MKTTLLEAIFCKKVYTIDFEGEVRKGVTKVIDGVRFVSHLGWCCNWYLVNEDGTYARSSFYIKKWAFTIKDLIKKD